MSVPTTLQTETRPTILLIDDDRHLLSLIRTFLSQRGFNVLVAPSGPEGLRIAYKHHPALIVLDLMMPGMDGWTVCRRLRDISDTPIIMLTAKDTEEDIIQGFELGADDYIVKPFSLMELLARIRAVLRRAEAPQQPAELRSFADGELVVDFARRRVIVRGEPVDLTPTEFELLSCLVRNAGRVVPREILLAQVWGDEYIGETQYLKLYIRYLRQKIERDPSNPEFILTEWGVGYRFIDE